MNHFIPSALLAAALVLTGCSGAGSTEGGSQKGELRTSTDGSSVRTVPSNAETRKASKGPYGGGSNTPAGGRGDGANGSGNLAADGPDADHDSAGSFENMSKACKAISVQMLSIAFAPLAYSYGGGQAETKEAVSELSELKERVPEKLSDDVDRVEEVFVESGHAYSNFDKAAFEKAVIPIEEWVSENCPNLR